MTREEKNELAQEEWEQALRENIEESEAMEKKLKAEGKYVGGLDTNQEYFRPIDEKLNRRLKEIQEKYR
ncbi:hypothetical protein [Bacilliculturomica massiliensis]|uniref:hypothetical protein n=1 Tax=Bacilliculturomica massiliensis TaxID=1917867 RepID=UPI001031CA0F|nr:hypothetical protein [Bacilliculturomica massiliensis]